MSGEKLAAPSKKEHACESWEASLDTDIRARHNRWYRMNWWSRKRRWCHNIDTNESMIDCELVLFVMLFRSFETARDSSEPPFGQVCNRSIVQLTLLMTSTEIVLCASPNSCVNLQISACNSSTPHNHGIFIHSHTLLAQKCKFQSWWCFSHTAYRTGRSWALLSYKFHYCLRASAAQDYKYIVIVVVVRSNR